MVPTFISITAPLRIDRVEETRVITRSSIIHAYLYAVYVDNTSIIRISRTRRIH